MNIKGYLSNLWQNTIRVGSTTTEIKQLQQYASLSAHADQIYGLRTSPKFLGRVVSGLAIDAADPNGILSRFVLPLTAHPLKLHDVIRMASGSLLGEEAQVIEVIDANSVAVVGLSAAPALGDTFDHLRPVTQTTDMSGVQLTTLTPPSVVDFLDNGLEVPTGGQAIPASAAAPLEIVASLAAAVTELQYIGDVGEFMNLYSDAAGTALICHLPLTPDEKVQVAIPAGTAIHIRNAKNVAIDDASSAYQINFLG